MLSDSKQEKINVTLQIITETVKNFSCLLKTTDNLYYFGYLLLIDSDDNSVSEHLTIVVNKIDKLIQILEIASEKDVRFINEMDDRCIKYTTREEDEYNNSIEEQSLLIDMIEELAKAKKYLNSAKDFLDDTHFKEEKIRTYVIDKMEKALNSTHSANESFKQIGRLYKR